MSFDGYTNAPSLAWAGWRLRIPGGPYGGQYHGYIAPDSAGWPAGRAEIYRPSGSTHGLGADAPAGPWSDEWGGTALREGESHSDYVYRSPAEIRPRPNASGGAHVIRSFQTRRSAGYAVAPGNYRGIGGMGLAVEPGASSGRVRYLGPPVHPGASTGVARQGPGDLVVRQPYDPSIWAGLNVCPAWGCGGPWRSPGDYFPMPGATSKVPLPLPSPPSPSNVVPVWSAPPVSPTPSPTVPASPADFLPSQGQNVPGITPGASAGTSFADWLSQSTIIPNIANQWVLGGAALFAVALMGRGRR
jgi:hypothetical protein